MDFKSLVTSLSILALGAAGCAPAAARNAGGPTPTVPSQALAPEAMGTLAVNESIPQDGATFTAEPFVLNFTPLPTETALATLELPTVPARAPELLSWDGLPTYPAESNPDYYFRVRYDPGAWALTTDAFGAPALAHRAIAGCIISPTSGRGLPPNATVEHDMRRIGGISYQISATSINGVKQSSTYAGGDGKIYTAFQVSLDERPDQCLLEAETVLSTLISNPVGNATPISTP
jgi:hypothetical protein